MIFWVPAREHRSNFYRSADRKTLGTTALAQVVEQWTGNPVAAGLNSLGRQLFALLVLSSRRSGSSSLCFRAGSL